MTRHYRAQRFEPGQLADCFATMLAALDITGENVNISARYDHGNGTTESKDLSPDALGTVCEIKEQPSSLSFSFPVPSEMWPRSSISLSYSIGCLNMHCSAVETQTSTKLISILEDSLSLKRTKPSFGHSETDDLLNRVSAIEERLSARTDRLSCFLSYRFNAHSKPLALELTRFLELLNVQVVSGSGYEPRRVSDKVMSRLEQPTRLLCVSGHARWGIDVDERRTGGCAW